MFVVNDDLSVYCTRGDYCHIPVDHDFKANDVVRFKATKKKDCSTVVIQRDFTISADTKQFVISLTGEDTKIGAIINKPVDYWYEVELNPETNPQTIVAYDEKGAKVFRLFPEGKDVDADDIEVVGTKTLQELVDYALAEAKESGEFDGKDGAPGKDGYTPVKGEDYFTEEDKTDFLDTVEKETLHMVANAFKGKERGNWIELRDISPIPHVVNGKASGKNLIPFPYPLDTSTGGGVTYTAQSNGGIKATGTATSQHNFTLYYGKLLAHEVVTFSLSGDYTNLVGVMVIRSRAGETLLNKSIDSSITVDLSQYPADAVTEILVKRKTNAAVSGTVYPQIEFGDKATEYNKFVDPSSIYIAVYGEDDYDDLYAFYPSADGTFEIPSRYPVMHVQTNDEGTHVEVEYNRDTTAALGDIETALDAIIAIQDSMIGGSA